MGIKLKVFKKTEELTNELKKIGLLVDRETEVQLRVGDQLIFYFSKGGSN